MKTHELAQKLLALPDLYLTVVESVGDAYTRERTVFSDPWVDGLGGVRVQVSEATGTEKATEAVAK